MIDMSTSVYVVELCFVQSDFSGPLYVFTDCIHRHIELPGLILT